MFFFRFQPYFQKIGQISNLLRKSSDSKKNFESSSVSKEFSEVTKRQNLRKYRPILEF